MSADAVTIMTMNTSIMSADAVITTNMSTSITSADAVIITTMNILTTTPPSPHPAERAFRKSTTW